MSTIKAAKSLLKRGYNVIPTTQNKLPAIGNWMTFQKKAMTEDQLYSYFKEEHNIGVLTGGFSRVICLDADMKYDLSGDLWERFKKAVPNKILKKTMCQSTVNKGYHLVFKVPSTCIRPNEKLAARPTTAYEKHQTYMEAFSDPEKMDKALKIGLNDSSRILFETRGGTPDACGGYFLIYPSAGYQYLGGTIGELTEEEFEQILSVARSFNQVAALDKPIEKPGYERVWEKTPFEHYNEEGDVLAVLLDNGWTALPEYRNNVRLLRPGKTFAKHSAMYDLNSGVLNVFSTSTIFDVNKGYSKASVFILLECEGDQVLAYKKLVDMGFGIPLKNQ